jgi:hypothetical protein
MPDVSWDDLLKEADKSEFQPLPVGVYDFVVSKSEATKSTGGKTMYKVTAEVENNSEYNRRKVFANLVVTPDSTAALMFFFRKMAAMGLDRDYFAAGPSEEAVAQALMGRKFRGKVKIEEYLGKDKNEIEEFMPPTGGNAAGPPPPAASNAPPPPVPPADSGGATAQPPPPPF